MTNITDIFVEEVESGDLFQFPMLPERISVTAATRFLSYDIMNTGEHVIPLGEELTGFKWQGLLPGESRKDAPFVRAWAEPNTIQGKWSHWRFGGKKLKLIVPGTPINHAVYLKSYDCSYAGGCGDIEYSIDFIAAKYIVITKEGETASSGGGSGGGSNGGSGGARTYTVVSGDTLWKIAQKTLGDGSRWREIYELNKGTIGSNPDLIYVGQVYNLP